MIETDCIFGTITIICDECDYEDEYGQVDIESAIESARKDGWETKSLGGEDWECVCVSCLARQEGA